LVKNASGQFIYAATVIRLLETPHRDPPEALLKAILATGATLKITSNPLEQLDALYSRILESSPDPPLSVRWIRGINKLTGYLPGQSSASKIHLLLQTDPETNEAEHLLGNLHSLIRIPPPSDQATTEYDFYHKSLFDFLCNPARCGDQQKLYVEQNEIEVFMWDRFVQACMSKFVRLSFVSSSVHKSDLIISKGVVETRFSSRTASSGSCWMFHAP
jgi:hypothetical protein